MSNERIESRYHVDPGGVHLDSADVQNQIDMYAVANLLFEIPSTRERPEKPQRNVVFDELWWVEPTVTGDNELTSLALLATAAHIARGALRASLLRVNDAHGGAAHWRVVVDASSVTGPPNYLPDNHHIQRQQEVSKEGATVEISRRHDGIVETIDLWFPAAVDATPSE